MNPPACPSWPSCVGSVTPTISLINAQGVGLHGRQSTILAAVQPTVTWDNSRLGRMANGYVSKDKHVAPYLVSEIVNPVPRDRVAVG